MTERPSGSERPAATIHQFEITLEYTEPRCTAGARACPPEDCGGVPGYAQICEALHNPAQIDEDVEDLLEWVGDDFDPAHFDPREVAFGSPARRLRDLRDAG